MRLYHGTNADFKPSEFKLYPRCYDEGVGVYFTPDLPTAETYGAFIFEIDLPKQERQLSSHYKTITMEEFETLVLALQDTHDYLTNWGDPSYTPLGKLVNDAIDAEYVDAESDAEILTSLGTACGDTAEVAKIASKLFNAPVMLSTGDQNKFKKDLYIFLDTDYLNVLPQFRFEKKPQDMSYMEYLEGLYKRAKK